MGGGGASGTIDFPTYIKEIHEGWMDGSGPRQAPISGAPNNTVEKSIASVMGYEGPPASGFINRNPFYVFRTAGLPDGGGPTNPTLVLNDVDKRYATYETFINSLDHETDWESVIDTAVSKFAESGVLSSLDLADIISTSNNNATDMTRNAIVAAGAMIPTVTLSNVVSDFRARRQTDLARATTRFSMSLSDVNAVHTSAFMFGVAFIEAENNKAISDFDSQLTLEVYRGAVRDYIQGYIETLRESLRSETINVSIRNQLLNNAVNSMTTMLSNTADYHRFVTAILLESKRIRTAALFDYEGFKLDVESQRYLWNIRVLHEGSNILAAPSGMAAYVPRGPTKTGSAVGGALSGAALGAQAGGAAGPVGAGIGAILGLGLGLTAGLVS